MARIIQTPAPVIAVLGATQVLATRLRRYIPRISRRAFIGGLIALATVFVTFLYLSEVFSARAASATPQSFGNKVYLGTPAAAASVGKKAPMHEMNIANNGLTLLRGGSVLSNDRGTMRVAITWGAGNFIWTVTTDSGTQFLTSTGEKRTIADIAVGDSVTVTGMLTSSGAEPVVNADYVRE